jgi:phage tail-like protein
VTIKDREEFRFLVLNTKADWDQGLAVGLQTADTGITLQETLEYTTERTIEQTALPPGLVVTDFAVGQCDLLSILDATSRLVWLYDPHQMRFESIACIEALFTHPTAITFTPGTLYVADDQAEQRLFALATINWQMRWAVSASQDATGQALGLENPFMPIDLAVDKESNLFALDQSNLVIVKFDRAGRLITVFGQEALAGKTPVAMAYSPEGFLYVLDQQDQKVLQFSTDGQLLNDTLITFSTLPFTIAPAGLAVDSQGQLYVGDGRGIAEDEEDDRFLRKFNSSGAYLGEISAYRGAVEKLVVDAADRIYLFNGEEGKIVILQLEPTFLLPGTTPPPIGYYFSQAFDSTASGMQWHKIVLETAIPENTQIRVSYLIAEEKKFLLDGVEDLDAFLRRADMTAEDKVTRLNQLAWSTPLVNPPDALIRSPTGRYLWLKIELIGSEQHSPTMQSIRVYFPRLSYLRYLPAVYQEDERSRDFLERFLSLFETFFAGLEWQIAHLSRYLDADAVSGDFLRWLASWLAISQEENWSEEKLRVLIKRAPILYKKHGTRAGIAEIIEICTGDSPFIVEQFQLQCAQAPAVKELLAKLYGADPYCFCVLLKPSSIKTVEEWATVRRIVDQEKPAHTCAGVQVLQPWIYLDMHTYLDINTYLSAPSPRLDVGAAMSRDTVLTDIPEAGQIERRARVGLDTTLT